MSLTKAVKLAFQKIAPLNLAENWDNVGLLVEPFLLPNAKPRRTVLLATDLTKQIVEDANEDVGSIVVYHPPIFSGLKALTHDNPLQSCLLQCAARGISVYSPHTSLDAATGGIQDWLAHGLGDGQWQSHSDRPRVWQLQEAAALGDIVKRIKAHLGMSTDESACITLMVAESRSGIEYVQTIGVCAGSGGSFLKGSKADLWWTGEMQHHDILATVASGTHVVLCTHTGTERPYLKSYFRAKLEDTLNEVRKDESLDDQPYSVIMSKHEVEVLQYV